MVQINLVLADSAINAEPSITHACKIICVHDGTARKSPAQDDADDAPSSLLTMTGDVSMPATLALVALMALSVLLVACRLRA